MSLLIESKVRERAQLELSKSYSKKSYASILSESQSKFYKSKKNDIFLSHSFKDAELILGIKGILEDLDYCVYVDWTDDSELDRSKVTRQTANRLRERMQTCKSLFYVATDNAPNSKWMPWECGYFDGINKKVAILPIRKESSSYDEYEGQEYLGLYPYCVMTPNKDDKQTLWIHYDKKHYTAYDNWVKKSDDAIEWLK